MKKNTLDGTSDQSGCKEKRCLHEFATPATKAAPYKDAFAPWSSAERNAHKLIFRCQFFVLSVCVSMHAERAHDGEQKVCFFWWLGAWENHVRVHPSLCLWLRLLHVSLHYVKFFTVIFTHSALASASASVHRAGTNMLSQHRGSTQANLSHSLRGVEAEWVKR